MEDAGRRNAHGDVYQKLNTSGSVAKTYKYDAFSNEVSPDANYTNPWRYSGEYFDKESGTVYLRTRYYDPGTGRFISEDPAKDGLNWYTYCGGNPITFGDSFGLEQIVVSGGAFHEDGYLYQYAFVDSALLQISMLKDDTTLLVANAGWTTSEHTKIEQAAEDQGINITWFTNTDELTSYINTGGVKGNGNRANDPITAFYVFAHGTDSETGNYAITFGLYSKRDEALRWYTGDISNIKMSVFSSDVISKFYACRTGNNFDGGNFAQTWADKAGGTTYAFSGLTKDVGRSDYSGILGNRLQRNDVFASKQFKAWKAARGEFTKRPGKAWRLPKSSYLTFWSSYYRGGPNPDPKPGPPPYEGKT